MRVIAICNQKGGVAKTTTTVNLAALLARDHAKRVLVIDADGQCNTTAFYEPAVVRGGGETLASLLRMPQAERTEFSVSFSLSNAIVKSDFPGVDLLPGDPDLQALDLSKAEDGSAFTSVLALGLPDLRSRYDYVLIDCPPAFNAASAAALLAADEVLIPIKLDAFALSGMAALTVQLTGMQRLNPRLRVLGLLPVMCYRSETTREAEDAVKWSDLPLLPRIRRSNRVDDMTFEMQPLCVCAPKSAAPRTTACSPGGSWRREATGMSDNWWNAIGAADIDNPASCLAALKAMENAIRRYQAPITAMFNTVPDIDKPIFLACLKLTYEAVKAIDRDAAEVVDAILALPIQTVAAVQDRREKGGADDGV